MNDNGLFFEARPPNRVRKVGVAWLRSFTWDWAWALTFEKYVPRDRARCALRQWLRVVARDIVGAHCRVAWVIERRRVGELFHIHLQLAPLEGATLDVRAAERAWRACDAVAGYTRCSRYRRGEVDERSHEQYLGKAAEWDIAIVCDRRPRCRRRHGCSFAHGPWI